MMTDKEIYAMMRVLVQGTIEDCKRQEYKSVFIVNTYNQKIINLTDCIRADANSNRRVQTRQCMMLNKMKVQNSTLSYERIIAVLKEVQKMIPSAIDLYAKEVQRSNALKLRTAL